jgi:hypothetical protein
MEELFTTLTRAVDGAPLIAISAAVAWGTAACSRCPSG